VVAWAVYAIEYVLWDQADGAFMAAVAVGLVVPGVAVGGLIWLPVLLAVRRSEESPWITAIMLSPIAGAIYHMLFAFVWGAFAGQPVNIGWPPVVALAPFMILLSAFFLWIDRRWGDLSGSGGWIVAIVAAAMLAAIVLFWEILWTMIRT
jgi:hypothetical protein